MSAQRIGIFGGSFDPVHIGHLLVAWAAREEARLDRMIWVPARISPFKQDQRLASAELRLRMLRLALAGLEWCQVSDIELRREGVSYSVDTVKSLRTTFPEASLYFLIGEDNLHALSSWREADTLMRWVEFLILPRPGAGTPMSLPGARLHSLNGWPIQVSSSDIRRRVQTGRSIRHLVPPAVAEVIHNNRLYLP